jgi:hypothetical protein
MLTLIRIKNISVFWVLHLDVIKRKHNRLKNIQSLQAFGYIFDILSNKEGNIYNVTNVFAR